MRHKIQLLSTIISNGYVIGFFQGKIYSGNLKMACVPGLNCYSCPGAIGSCPIGSLQSALAGREKNVPYFIIGILLFLGIMMGRLVCGFLCPFGFFQDLLYKVKIKKRKINTNIDKKLRFLKYIVLVLFVIILPVVIVDSTGLGEPMFCKWLCPAGTFEAGIPLIITNPTLRYTLGFIFSFKMLILLSIIILSMIVYRPFCKYLCPLGAFYGMFNKLSFYQMKVDFNKCNGCKECVKTCKMGVDVLKNINSAECIRCGDCKTACNQNAITSGLNIKK
ncbi:MAG: 4Fe-4S binding protein [Anaerovoracaceae bacterium]